MERHLCQGCGQAQTLLYLAKGEAIHMGLCYGCTSTNDDSEHSERTPERTCFLADVLVTAVEGGISYWCDHQNYSWAQDEETDYMTDAFVEVDAGDGKGWMAVTLDTIEAGIAKVKESGFLINSGVLSDILIGDNNDDGGDVDSIAADCIVQAGLFGEVIYG